MYVEWSIWLERLPYTGELYLQQNFILDYCSWTNKYTIQKSKRKGDISIQIFPQSWKTLAGKDGC